jgi:hypothetical protein
LRSGAETEDNRRRMGGASSFEATERFDVRSPLPRATLTRRRLLELAGLAAITQLPLLADTPAARITGATSGGDVFRRSTYAPLVGRRFAFRGDAGESGHARLVEVRDLGGPAGRHAHREDAFSLLFHGPRAPRLPQGMYELRRPGLARDRLLLVPVGTGRRGQDYQVVINQSRARRG